MSNPEHDTDTNPPEAARPDRLALGGAAVTAALSFVPLEAAPWWGAIYIAGACLFWAAFVAVRARQDRRVFRRWGFRADNLLRASVIPAVVFVLGAAGLAALACQRGTLRFPPHTLLLFPVYSMWGLIQQMLVLGIFAQSLEALDGLRRRRVLLVLLVALVFGLIHVPYPTPGRWELVVSTFLLELVIVPVYLWQRNLWPLGVLHGCLGGLFYLWILNRDLWAEYIC
jgi:hypothetical protein